MKKMLSSMLRVVPAFLLVLALVFSLLPSEASAASTDSSLLTVPWYYGVTGFYEADLYHAMASVSLSRIDCTWTSGDSVSIGLSATFSGGSPIVISPFGDWLLSLQFVPLGQTMQLGFEFIYDPIYTGCIIDYFSVVRYYDNNGNYIGIQRSDDHSFVFGDSGDHLLFFDVIVDGLLTSTGERYMPAFCTIEFYVFPTIDAPLYCGFYSNYSYFVLDDSLKELFDVFHLSQFKELAFDVLLNQSYQSNYSFLFNCLTSFFFTYEGPVIGDFDSSLSDDLGSFFDEVTSLLVQYLSAFSAVSAFFQLFINIPIIGLLLYVSLAFGLVMTLVGIGSSFGFRSSVERRGKSSDKDEHSSRR